MRLAFIIIWLGIIAYGISYLFWMNEWKYTLPTPVPEKYETVKPGAVVELGNTVQLPESRPVFLHFYNPDCPCSRFNIPHVRSLVTSYGNEISFAIVVMSNNDKYSEEDIRDKFNVKIPVYFDKTIAPRCGVYSTPQAVLLDESRRLYYRGNYNKSRYCTDRNTNYAQMAIDTLLQKQISPVFSDIATRAYGCELPTCSK